MGEMRKLLATKSQLIALILVNFLCPLMSLIMLLAIPRYGTVKERSHFYLFSVLALPSGAITGMDTGITPGETLVQLFSE